MVAEFRIKRHKQGPTSSASWIKKQNERYEKFYWQRGYFAFSVSASHVDHVSRYIESQPEHYGTITLRDEYRKILQEHKIDLLNYLTLNPFYVK